MGGNMAIIYCPECDKEISDQATHCVHCGYPIAAETAADEPEPEYETRYAPISPALAFVIGYALVFGLLLLLKVKGIKTFFLLTFPFVTGFIPYVYLIISLQSLFLATYLYNLAFGFTVEKGYAIRPFESILFATANLATGIAFAVNVIKVAKIASLLPDFSVVVLVNIILSLALCAFFSLTGVSAIRQVLFRLKSGS